MQRRNRPSCWFIIGIVVAVFFAGESLSQEETEWRDRFLSEAPKRWEDYLRFARSLQITVTAHRYKGADQDLVGSSRTEYKQTKGASLRVEYRKSGPKSKKRRPSEKRRPESEAEVEGTNPSYSFKLTRRSPDSGWIIADLELPGQSVDFNNEQRKDQERILHYVCHCLMLENLWLPTLIEDPDFRITAIKAQEIDGRPVVRFDFDYPKPEEDYPHQSGWRIKGGWMVLDPEHDWVLREYVVHTGHPERFFLHQTFQIREGTDRHPIITRHNYELVVKGRKPPDVSIAAEWLAVEPSEIPLEEFTLSAFGLPEPPGLEVRRSRLYLWLSLAGIVCLGIAVLIRWQIRRRRMAA